MNDTYCAYDTGQKPSFSTEVKPEVGTDLPTIGPDDNGKIPVVVDGKVAWIDPTSIPGLVTSAEISVIKVLDKSEYDALEVKSPTTLYCIRG